MHARITIQGRPKKAGPICFTVYKFQIGNHFTTPFWQTFLHTGILLAYQ